MAVNVLKVAERLKKLVGVRFNSTEGKTGETTTRGGFNVKEQRLSRDVLAFSDAAAFLSRQRENER